MRWTGWSEFPVEVMSSDLAHTGERSGLHLSAIIHEMKVAQGEKIGPVKGDQEGVRLQEGFLWETALEYVAAGMTLDEAMDLAFKRYLRALRSSVTTQVKLERDGIKMTPDAFNADEGIVESYKLTRRTLNRAKTQDEFEDNFWPWLVQEKSYAYALGVDTARWIVLWQAGDYSRGYGSGPRMLECTAVFTPEELVENWRRVLEFAKPLREK